MYNLNYFLITRDWIHQHINGGSITKAQMEILGVKEKKKGWLSGLIGKEISLEEKKAFERLSFKSFERRAKSLF